MIESTKKYAFVLGREQEICLEELKSVLARFCFCFSIFRISGNVVFAKMTGVNDDGICDLINTLAGTVKIFELVDSLGNDIPVQLTKLLSDRKADNRHPEPAPPCHPEPAPPCHPERSEGSSISKPEIPRQDPDPSTSLGTTSSARDEFPGRKFNFGVSCFNKNITRQQINSFALTAKKKLKGRYSLRYVESRDSAELS